MRRRESSKLTLYQLRKAERILRGFFLNTVALIATTFLASLGFIFLLMKWRGMHFLKAFKRQQSLLQSVIKNMGDGLVVVSRSGKKLVLNDSARSILNLNKVGDQAWSEVLEIFGGYEVKEDEILDFEVLPRALHGEEVYNQEVSLRTEGGNEMYLNCSARPMCNAEGEVRAAVVVFRDITAEKQAQDKLEETRSQLVEMEKMAALGLMSGGIAHEINNPLAIILGTVELLEELNSDGPIAQEMLAESLGTIGMTSDRIAGIVRGLKLLSRDSSKDNFAPSRIKEIIEDTVLLGNARLKREGVEVRYVYECEDEKDLKINCQAGQISQVVLNLVSNAVDAMSDLDEKWIEFRVVDHPHMVEIFVSDGGPGVPEKLRQQIFQPFFTTKEAEHGTGLGLSISTNIVKMHHGEFQLVSSEKSCFRISLPKAMPMSLNKAS